MNIMIVGVGGQGTLLASRILGKVAIKEGYDVKVSEVHGMSQRGGSVVTYVKYGDKVYSPIIDLSLIHIFSLVTEEAICVLEKAAKERGIQIYYTKIPTFIKGNVTLVSELVYNLSLIHI